MRWKERATKGHAKRVAIIAIEFEYELSGILLLDPVSQADVLLDLPPFVPVLLGLDGPIIGFTEGMFGVPYDFRDYI
jgi:hypothetical protein